MIEVFIGLKYKMEINELIQSKVIRVPLNYLVFRHDLTPRKSMESIIHK